MIIAPGFCVVRLRLKAAFFATFQKMTLQKDSRFKFTANWQARVNLQDPDAQSTDFDGLRK